MSATYEQLADILAEELGQLREELDPALTFDDLGFDSLALLELGVVVQERLGFLIEGIGLRSTLAEAAALLDAASATAATGPAA
ncbi:acyl carrier protein [Streptomyces sp. NPDC005492]|uniref:acyl carrier protein n=1 Tax=Streptomyces sp. NPDC005492 TaxID=3156883 RepID=UPI0033A04A7B